jgi:uncharacterized damage-inducible protein DinB
MTGSGLNLLAHAPRRNLDEANLMTTVDSDLTALFLATFRKSLFGEFWPRTKTCVASFTAEQIWWRPNDASNSIGNLLLHLNGNVRQWIVTSFSGSQDKRDRPAEFAAKEGATAQELLDGLGATLDEAAAVLDRLTTAELLASYDIQGYRVSGLYAIYHVVEHFGMHYGQIVYITKLFYGKDLGFYKHLNQTGRDTSPREK